MARPNGLSDKIKLIQACAKAGVESFELGDLKVTFSGKSNAAPFQERDAAPVEDIAAGVNQEIMEREIDDLLVSDPLSYEKELMKAE